MRARFIYEVFNDESDPIKDMDIGMMHKISKFCKSKYRNEDNIDKYLVTCAKFGKLDYVKYLIEEGADISYADNAALRTATYEGYFDIVKYLIEHGANIHADDDYAFRYAKAQGHLHIVRLLKSIMRKEQKNKMTNESFDEESDPIDDMEIGKVDCPKCFGTGSYPEHDPNSIDPETGEHDCRYCPIEVECEECEGTGKISKKKYKKMTKTTPLDQRRKNQKYTDKDDLPF